MIKLFSIILLIFFSSISLLAQNQKITQSLKILSKPIGSYTDTAKKNNIEGKVQLEITFKKDGTIGKIKIIKALPFGLTERAYAAAKKIKFEPEIINGKPKTVKKILEYNFTIY